MRSRTLGLLIASTALLSAPRTLAEPTPIVEELFKANETLGGRSVTYPKGKPEMRMYKITLLPGARIPLHIHPSPVIVYVKEGVINNIRLVDGVEMTDIIKAGDGFLEGSPEEPHYVVNKGLKPAISIVTFASVEGMPNLIKVEE